MNYRHAYHAGNFADVVKHLTLVALIERLLSKDTPLAYLDTHAGRGRYRLDSAEALASGEGAAGILALRKSAQESRVELFNDYFRIIDNERAEHGASCYPGSPAIAAQLLRATDRLILGELVPAEAQALKHEFGGDERVGVRVGNGYQLLKSELPPKERRGLILIDPPFERQVDEFKDILGALSFAHERFVHGVYALWYPVKLKSEVDGFVRAARKLMGRPSARLEWHRYPATTANRLNGAGMLIFNPPYLFEQKLKPALLALNQTLKPDGALPLIFDFSE